MNDAESSPEERSDLDRRHEHAVSLMDNNALESVRAMGLPVQIEIPNRFEFLGKLVVGDIVKARKEFESSGSTNAPAVLALALREMWLAAWRTAHYLRLLHQGLEATVISDASRQTWDARWHIESQGWAGCLEDALYEETIRPERIALAEDLSLEKHPGNSAVGFACALYLFIRANQCFGVGNTAEGTDFLHDAYGVLTDEHGKYMWEEAEKHGREVGADESVKAARSSIARGAAAVRHAENRAMKQEVFAWCDQHMATVRSMDQAASVVTSTLVPVAWRTVRDWMTEWKKLRSAGTA